MVTSLLEMGSNGHYPDSNGIRFGLVSQNFTVYPIHLIEFELLVGGDPDESDCDYGIEVLDQYGNWLDCPDAHITQKDGGSISGVVEGCAIRLNADNGSSPGTGTDTPRYHLNARKLNLVSIGHLAVQE